MVVGKGGVGKTTTAAALALRLADAGARTHLLSIDPAHSLGDVFLRPMEGRGAAPRPCTENLTLEELDGPGEAERWFSGVRDAFVDLVDHGTYLEREDIVLFLDRSLPGMDEVMAAVRIAKLADTERCERVVVDTAPTGHTLRMLRAGETIRGWVEALEAMADKASAVGTAMRGRRIRLAGEVVLDELRSEIDGFERCVRSEADFVVVTREGAVVEAETRRYVERLRESGHRVAAIVGVGGGLTPFEGVDVPRFEVPLRSNLDGCEGLRLWGLPPAGEEVAVPESVKTPDLPCEDVVVDLARREMVFFAGKGGVGKSTCAAAFALRASRDRTVLLLSLDPAGSIGDVLGKHVGTERTWVGDRLEVRQLDADLALAHFRDRHGARIRETFERLGLQRSMALDRRVLETIVDMAPPGLDELFGLDAILDGSDGHDLVVIDTAPTGHFLRLLEMSDAVLDWTRSVLRVLLRYRTVLGLDDTASETLGFARRLRGLAEMLRDPRRTGVVVVTSSGVLAERETQRLVRTLHDREVDVAAVVLNCYRPDGAWSDRLPGRGAGGPGRILAPRFSPPPVGVEPLLGFLQTWRCP